MDNWRSQESSFSINASFHEFFTSTHINTHLLGLLRMGEEFVDNSDALLRFI